jgi:hypothetical protein
LQAWKLELPTFWDSLNTEIIPYTVVFRSGDFPPEIRPKSHKIWPKKRISDDFDFFYIFGQINNIKNSCFSKILKKFRDFSKMLKKFVFQKF